MSRSKRRRRRQDPTGPAPSSGDPPRRLTEAELEEIWRPLPRRDKELLCLLSDSHGRVVPWLELRRKLGLRGDPSPARDWPRLVGAAEQRGAAVPVRQHGKGEEAVFTLDPDLIAEVRQVRRTWPVIRKSQA